MIARLVGRGLGALALVGAFLVVGAHPAGAVAPRPTDTRSTVVSLVPGSTAVQAEVLGGDSLMQVSVPPGHTVDIPGYEDEPYLRIQPDGTVQVNDRSPAGYLNRSTNAGGAVPAIADTHATPTWRTIATDGRAIWHDHRIHLQPGEKADPPIDWTIPLTVDGQAVTINGEMSHVNPPSPVPYLAAAIVTAGAVWLLGRRQPVTTAQVALVVASVIAGVTGWVEWVSVPDVVVRNAGLFLLPLGALALVALARWLPGTTARLVAALASVSLLAGWVAFRWSILTRSILISHAPEVLDRLGLAVVIGMIVAAAGLVVGSAGTLAVAPEAHPGTGDAAATT